MMETTSNNKPSSTFTAMPSVVSNQLRIDYKGVKLAYLLFFLITNACLFLGCDGINREASAGFPSRPSRHLQDDTEMGG
jgi:hypothetical protein